MRTGWLDIELRSDLAAGSGEGIPGLTDTDIAHDHGLPVIPAKRIKGCLLDAGKELCDWGLTTPEMLEALFGSVGSAESSALHLSDARLYRLPGVAEPVDDYDTLMGQLKQKNAPSPREVLPELTVLRTRTAIDGETGSAARHTLRTIRVVERGMVLRCRVELRGQEASSELENLLEQCVRATRHIGLGRTRGLGEVRCGLTGMQTAGTPGVFYAASPEKEDEPVVVSCRFRLDTPVMLAGRGGLYSSCEDGIPGSAVLGALAGMYITDHALGGKAHEDETFSRIFLRGGVSFGYAFPEADGRVFLPCPASWQQVKNGQDVYDLAGSRPPEGVRLRSIGRLVHPGTGPDGAEQTLLLYEPEKEVRMHHARPVNRGFGHAFGPDDLSLAVIDGLPEAPADRGQFFQYVSLKAGQTFAGTLRGRRGDIRTLLISLARRENRLRLGRSRTAEYGSVTFIPGEEQAERVSRPPVREFTVQLLTPLLLGDASGRPDPDPEALIRQLNDVLDCGAELKQAWLRFTELSGYNAAWRMPRPRKPALDAGSALQIRTSRPVSPAAVEGRLWGLQTGEGCGQVLVILPAAAPEGPRFRSREADPAQETPAATSGTHAVLEWIAARMEGRERRRQAEAEAIAAAEKTAADRRALPGSAKIHQLLALVRRAVEQNPGISSEELENKLHGDIKHIASDEIRKKCQTLFGYCSGRPAAFWLAYFEHLKLKARNET